MVVTQYKQARWLWRIIVNYGELARVVPTTHACVHNIALVIMMEQLAETLFSCFGLRPGLTV